MLTFFFLLLSQNETSTFPNNYRFCSRVICIQRGGSHRAHQWTNAGVELHPEKKLHPDYWVLDTENTQGVKNHFIIS